MEGVSDKDIAEKLRKENYEQYKQLVRMHLSFELDLNTDEFDLPCHEVVYYEKGKVKKWNRLTKKIKSCTSTKSAGSPLEGGLINLTLDLINQLRQLKEFLLKESNIKQEGIFRRTGAVSRQNELRNLINQHKEFDLNENYTVHDCATIYKSFLADLSEPLLTDAHYPAHCQIADLCNGVEGKEKEKKFNDNCNKESHLLSSMQLLVLLLPIENRILLEDIIAMLNQTSTFEKFNKMSPNTLATLFSPHLICPRNLPPAALHFVSQRMSSVISYMIFKGNIIFEIPSKLATDIRAYFHEIKRKKTMSPDHTLDESISDISTVNTVYTFVDREKTAAEHNSNPTDTALAQLYAHIQSLPESSKKRKLIKQFNKENGQGTPLQMLMVNRMKNNELPRSGGKSFSDAIKKHIFHKGLISRTPKRLNSSNNSNNNSSTPNGTVKTPRTRILFPSQIITNSNIQEIKEHQHNSNSIRNHVIPIVNKSNTVTINTITKNFHTTITQQHHPLQKSISASSILSTSSTGSTNSLNLNMKTISAPISRFCSNEFDNNDQKSSNISATLKEVNKQLMCNNYIENDNDANDPIKWLNKKPLIKDIDYNSDDDSIDDIQINSDLDKFLTPIKNQNKMNKSSNNINTNLKSKFKSEPNLFNLIKKNENLDIDEQGHNYYSTPNTRQQNRSDGKFKDYIPKIKNSLIRAVSLSSLIGNLSSTSNIMNTHSDKLKIVKKSITNKTIYFNKNLNTNKLNDTLDSFKDCLSTIQSEGELSPCDNPSESNDIHNINDNNSYKYKNNILVDFNIEDDKVGNLDDIEEENDTKLVFSNENIVGSYQNLNLYRNIDLVTSTPSEFFRRRSMSPITKSTQRMPKAMQESIMTPRSRKPVMLMATNVGSLSHDQSQNILQQSEDFSNFNENEENEIDSPYIRDNKINTNTKIINHQHHKPNYTSSNVLLPHNFFVGCSEMEPKSIAEAANISNKTGLEQQHLKFNNFKNNTTLSNTFREYLLSRSVLTGSPVDSSFSSQPDDFGSTPNIEDLTESQMSSSLLHFLDGNEPVLKDIETNRNNNVNCEEFGIDISSCDNDKQNITDDSISNSNNNRYSNIISKDILKTQQRKRNCNTLIGNNDNISTYPDDIFNTRKLLIIEENPNETSL